MKTNSNCKKKRKIKVSISIIISILWLTTKLFLVLDPCTWTAREIFQTLCNSPAKIFLTTSFKCKPRRGRKCKGPKCKILRAKFKMINLLFLRLSKFLPFCKRLRSKKVNVHLLHRASFVWNKKIKEYSLMESRRGKRKEILPIWGSIKMLIKRIKSKRKEKVS